MPPIKPFETYKWRWLSVQPSEGLLRAPVFLGVLRALARQEGEPFSSYALKQDLVRVQEQTKSTVNLARDTDRNLFRNSGQYWKGTGLIKPRSGIIELTGLGRRVASGAITNDEFASLIISNTVLPNPLTYASSEMRKWKDAELRIKPFEIILNTLNQLRNSYGSIQGFITPNELIKIIIPLAGEKASIERITNNIIAYRNNRLPLTNWPDCAPAANDKRLAREFLLFLEYFGVCQVESHAGGSADAKFSLAGVEIIDYVTDGEQSFFENSELENASISEAQASNIPLIIERTRTLVSLLSRPSQARFRRDVLSSSKGLCIITNEQTPQVVEAAHIIPVKEGGSDDVSNGLCMRVDIHRLYDAGKIRIKPDGQLVLSESIRGAVSYSNFPPSIKVPSYVDINKLSWRHEYL